MKTKDKGMYLFKIRSKEACLLKIIDLDNHFCILNKYIVNRSSKSKSKRNNLLKRYNNFLQIHFNNQNNMDSINLSIETPRILTK